jgi:hypothetical protein
MTSTFDNLLFNLPKDIMDLIHSYNYNHRPQMVKLFDEMNRIYFPLKSKEYWIDKYNDIIFPIPFILHCDCCGTIKEPRRINSSYCGEACEIIDDRGYESDPSIHGSDYDDFSD